MYLYPFITVASFAEKKDQLRHYTHIKQGYEPQIQYFCHVSINFHLSQGNPISNSLVKTVRLTDKQDGIVDQNARSPLRCGYIPVFIRFIHG